MRRSYHIISSWWSINNLVLLAILASAKVSFTSGAEIVVNKTGDYDNVSFPEPFKTTVLSFAADSGLSRYEKIEWRILFKPNEDEIWPDYQQDILAEEVGGHTLLAEVVDGTPSATISHMFRLPGTYSVKAVGTKAPSTNATKASKAPKFPKASEFPKASKSPKAPKSLKASKSPKTPKSSNKDTKSLKKTKPGKQVVLAVLATSDIRVQYGRRDVIDLSPTDWDNYVDAIWTLKEISSEEGKRNYNCQNFFNLDVFTAMHGVLSHDPRCDQNHFSLMQETAHHAWMTLLERSLQCVHPDIAMPFYNVAKDKRKYYNPDIGAKSMNDSPIFGPDYYGGGHANWDDRDDSYDPYYVEDGRFKNFPLRQNRTGLCDESVGLFDDETYIPLCKHILESDFPVWQVADPAQGGMWVREPRDLTSYEYVSARRWYAFGNVSDNFLPNFVPNHEMINAMTTTKDVTEQFMYVSNAKIHGYAHKMLSGLWGGGIDETTRVPMDSIVNRNRTILDTFRTSSGLLVLFSWTDELSIRDAGCFKCTKEGCEIDMDYAVEKNCYNINNNFAPPANMREPFWNENAENGQDGSLWFKYVEQMNKVSWMKHTFYGYGTYHANSGTFGRHSWANQDPMFYVHHAFTFLLNDFGFKALEDRGEIAPLYGMDDVLSKRGYGECEGQNPQDMTVYRNVVRYKVGQQPGTNQTWEHMLDMWSEERRDYEWIINDDKITNFDKTVRYDDSCRDGCLDEALIITGAFPPTMSLEQQCQAFVGNIMQNQNKTLEEACASKLKDVIPTLPFLPFRFDLFSYSCKKTCKFCRSTCG